MKISLPAAGPIQITLAQRVDQRAGEDPFGGASLILFCTYSFATRWARLCIRLVLEGSWCFDFHDGQRPMCASSPGLTVAAHRAARVLKGSH